MSKELLDTSTSRDLTSALPKIIYGRTEIKEGKMPTSDDTRLMTPADAGSYLGGYSPAALAQLRYTGGGPKFIKLSSRAVRYRQADLDEWIESRVRRSTADHSPAA